MVLKRELSNCLLIFLTLFMLQGCERTNVPVQSDNKDKFQRLGKTFYSEDEMSIVAKVLAKSLEDNEFKRVIKVEQQLTKFKHKALDLSTFLRNSAKKYLSSVIDQYNTEERERVTKLVQNINFGDMKIYFPWEQHRNSWDENGELLIAGLSRSEKDHSDIVSYNSKGEEVILSATIPPSIPTLVIYPDCVQENDKNSFFKSIVRNAILTTDDETIEDNWYDCTVTGMSIAKHYDDWWCDELEMFIRYKYKLDGGVWSNWIDLGYGYFLVDPGHTKSFSTQLVRYDKNFSLEIELWEYDGDTGPDDFVADAYWTSVSGCGLNYNTNVIRCNYGSDCRDRQLLDGFYPSGDYDFLWLHFNSRF